jgi:hypothetical protein
MKENQMLTKKEAIREVDYVMDHSDLVKDLISKIYDSIGTCGECKHYDQKYKCCESPIQEDRNDVAGSYYTSSNWYCADFEKTKS